MLPDYKSGRAETERRCIMPSKLKPTFLRLIKSESVRVCPWQNN